MSELDNAPEPKPKREHPLWETIVMAVSFALLWAWFLARQSVSSTRNQTLWPGWTALQILALLALVFITVRRMKRLREALREGAQLPNQFPHRNGTGKHK